MSIYSRFEPMRESDDPDWLPVSRREVYTQKGDYYVLFQNGKGWEVTFRGARPLPEDSLHRYRESTRRDIFYILRYRFNEPGMYFYYAGTEIIDNVPTHAIEIVDGRGEAVTVYLRMSDNLPVQQVYIRRDPKTRIPYEEKSVFSKYRKVGQVTLPWNVQRRRDDSKHWAKHLLAQCLEAIGGDAFLNVKNMVQKGRAYSFQRQNLRGLAVMSIYSRFEPMRESDDPDWLPVSRREVYTQKGDYYVLFQNGKGWEVTFRGARPLPEDSLHRYRESTRRDIFYILRYRFNEPGM